MKIFILCLTLSFSLPCLVLAMEKNSSPQKELAQKNIVEAIEKARTYFGRNEYESGQKLLEEEIALAEGILGSSNLDIVVAKFLNASFLVNIGKPNEAYNLIISNMPLCIDTFGENSRQVYSYKLILLDSLYQLGRIEEAAELLDELLVLCIEISPDQLQGVLFFPNNVIFCKTSSGAKTAFYIKIWAGMESFCLSRYPGYRSYVDIKTVFKELHDVPIPFDLKAAIALLSQKNIKGDTIYNKARSLMVGPEVELYAVYSAVAQALHEAGQGDDEESKEKARQDFREWLKLVDDTLSDR